ncbi:sterol desaturase family protein [Catellatospora vulcania]|uniref:sterol desaturase family protein n=1 Tax=Catellatospora vulcania TaxID=1460450 RepID=UPI0012D47F96|nr:sterol desaturase family protein [Catellatospora vulcania]
MTAADKAAAARAARDRLAADVATGPTRTAVTLRQIFARFWRHPSPWMILAVLAAALAWRVAEGGWTLADLRAPALLVAAFPALEWVVHVFVLHWRPRRIAGLTIDTELARDHRRHHADPRDTPLVFIPWRSLTLVIAAYSTAALLAFPRLGEALTFIGAVAAAGLLYEWTHYAIHSDYRPRGRLYRAVWRNHRLHHYKNEHYWFTVTTAGTADRLLRTYPDPATVPTSATARNLHAAA